MTHSKEILVINLCSEEMEMKVHDLVPGIEFKKVVYTSQSKNESDQINFDELYKQSYDKAFESLISYGDYELSNRKTIAETLVDQTNRSLWFYFRFMILYKFRRRVFEQMVLEQAGKIQNQYEKLVVIHESNELEQLIRTTTSFESVIYRAKRKKSKAKKLTLIIKFAFLSISRFIIGIISLPAFFRAKHLFLSDASANQKVLSVKNFTVVKGDHFSEYFQSFIENRRDFLNVSEFFPPSLANSEELHLNKRFFFARHKNVANFETVLYIQLLNPLFYIRSFHALRRIRKGFQVIEKTKTTDFLDHSFLQLIQAYKRLSYFICLRKSAVYYLLKLFNYKSIASTHEHNVKVKSIMEVAEQVGIKTYGIQHGVIHSKHLHYIFSESDAKHKPFPDQTFLWGNYWKSNLLKYSNYKEKNTKVVGQLRTDIIPAIKNWAEKEKKKRNKFTILYPSQPLYVGEESMRKKLAIDFLKLTIAFPDFNFIVKPHPFEKDCKLYFNKLANEMGATNFRVLDDDLYKMLAFSDLVMIYNSTVGAEAIYFDKPLIVMNYSNNDFSGYTKVGIAKEVNNFHELKASLNQLYNGENFFDKEKVNSFIRERAYKVDGNTCKRIVDSVREDRVN